MRWKLLSLSALLVTATSGRILTVEREVVNLNLTLDTSDTVVKDHSSQSIDEATREQSKHERYSDENHSNPEDKSNETQKSGENPFIVSSKSWEDSTLPSAKTDRQNHTESKPESNENSTGVPGSNSSSPGKLNGSRKESFDVVVNERKTDENLIQTTHGPVKGIKWNDNPDIVGFIDIPYGKITTPFEAPVTSQSWLDVHEITEHTKRCPQIQNDEYIGDMNCLTLSIFAPVNKENANVFFYIHDDYSSTIKSADPSIYGPEYLVPKGIILVLPNYRLGPMGFLCLQNETAPGNAGLKDLSLALEWVKENIRVFGGNPENIVVGGDGAAGAYASYLALCSRSKYYINKVITESGSALSHWALDRDPKGKANTLAEKIRKDYPDGNDYDNTFREVPLETIIKAAKDMRLHPCLELDKEPFMNGTPWEMLQGKEIDTTFMIGSAKYAGTHEAIHTTEYLIHQLNNHFDEVLPDDLIFTNEGERLEYAQKLKTQYFGERSISLAQVKELSLWHTDSSYLSPTIRLARPLVAAGAVVYFYEFAFVGNLNRELESMNKPVPGAVRSDIVGYLFHKDGTEVEDETPEKHMINLMVDLWVSFINSGKPAAENVEWNEMKKVDASEEEWLLIDSEPKLEKGLHLERLQLWTDLYKQYFIEAPEPPPSWDGIFEGTHRIKCSQGVTGDENCLVLNVFTPPSGAHLPVLVFVHDGQFQNGWGAHHPPPGLLDQNVIIVTFNYRLGMLGFLCLGIPEAPGNAGLKDQVAALYWVQMNIANFGGNPADVTVYGIGSGAIAVHLLLLSGLTEGLFQKVVLESGSALSPFALTYEPVTLGFEAAASLGYEGTDNSTELVQFLNAVSAKRLTNISEIFLPCIENYEYEESLLEWDAMEVLKKGSFQQVPILMMYSNQDGISLVKKNTDHFSNPPQSFQDLLPTNLAFNDGTTKLKIAKFVKEFYFDDDRKSIEEGFADYFHDVLYEYPIIKSSVLYAEQSSAPLYVLKFTYNQKMFDEINNTEFPDISNYLFTEEIFDEGKEVCRKLVTLLCNFIKVGDPTPITTSDIPIIWQPLQEYDGVLKVHSSPVLVLNAGLSMSSAGTNQRLAFWDQVYENFYKSYAPIHQN